MTVPLADLSSVPHVSAEGTHGVAAMRVPAPADDVWKVILAVEDWSSFVPHIARSTVTTRSGTSLAGDVDVETKDIETTLALRLAHPPGTVAPFVVVPSDTSIVRAVSGLWIVTPIDADHSAIELQLDFSTTFWVPDALYPRARDSLGTLIAVFAKQATR